MSAKEAKARIKINKLLEDAGWRFFDNEFGPANIQVEANLVMQKRLNIKTKKPALNSCVTGAFGCCAKIK